MSGATLENARFTTKPMLIHNGMEFVYGNDEQKRYTKLINGFILQIRHSYLIAKDKVLYFAKFSKWTVN